jgi:hypothetical protein
MEFAFTQGLCVKLVMFTSVFIITYVKLQKISVYSLLYFYSLQKIIFAIVGNVGKKC